MTECKAVVEQVHVSAEEKAFMERVRELLEEELGRILPKRRWPVERELQGPVCRAVLDLPELLRELTIVLPKCGPEFYKQCDFDRLVRICPFDPAWDAFDWKQQVVSERLQALEVQVKELQAKLPAHK